MPDLTQSLQGRDLGHLRIVAELWGIELNAAGSRLAFQRLIPAMLNPHRVRQVLAGLSEEASLAVQDLLRSEGRLPWSLFIRRYGAVREMGPARRDRERPYLKPSSPAEELWYRALAARAFFDTDGGPAEFAYLPTDLLPFIPLEAESTDPSYGRAASAGEAAHPFPATDHILDHACTYLAALRSGMQVPAFPSSGPPGLPPLTASALGGLLAAAGLIEEQGQLLPEPVRLFLEAPRGEALALLAGGWRRSPEFNELRMIPHLQVEGAWENQPLQARQAVLEFLATLPSGTWWSLPAFVNSIRQRRPDFQRPAGDYDSWFIRDLRQPGAGEFLRGFEHWEDVDGALVRYLIGGPLRWLGILDLASPSPESPPAAFRRSAWAGALLAGRAPQGLPVEGKPLLVRSDARLVVPRLAPRPARYQISRFCSWEGEKGGEYIYRITPAALQRARQQGLTVGHLLGLLRRYAQALPPGLIRLLERWEQKGTEAHFEQMLVLRVSSPDLLQSLRASKAARYFGDPLGPTAISVKPGALEKVLAALSELGVLGEIVGDGSGAEGRAG